MNNLPTLYWFATYAKSGVWKKSVIAVATIVTLGLASCAQTTTPQAGAESAQPDAVQAANSRDAADLTATAIGTESGGSGMVLGDALTLAKGGSIPGAILKAESDTSTVHTVTVTRSKTWSAYNYSGTWTHTWSFFDASGNVMPKFIKGQTDKVVISSHGQHTVSTPRAAVTDSSSGSWTISNLIAQPDSATLNGSLTRAGSTDRITSGKTRSHSFTINWNNDILVKTLDRDMDDTVTYLLGNATSDFKATGFNGQSVERQDSIVFHGDGTATLTITRTSGNGTVDTFTIDVKRGIWMRDEFLGRRR